MAQAQQTYGGRVVDGRVIRASSEKTRVILLELRSPHPLYGKGMKRSAKAVAHDERGLSGVGDVVRLRECRPMSKTKRWRVVDVVKKATVEA